MRKLKIILLVLFAIPVICMLSACSLWGSKMEVLNNESDEKNAAILLDQVIQAVNSKDKEAVTALFSNKALEKAYNFDENAEFLFEFIQGTIKSWEKLDGPTVFESINEGIIIKEVSSYYLASTDKGDYFILLRDYPVDTGNSDNEGLYMLLVVKAEDEEKIWDGANKIIYDGDVKLSHPGIYLPIE